MSASVKPCFTTVRENFLPYSLPSIGREEIAEVVDTLRSGWVTTGPKVKRFEADFAESVAARHAIAVNSCTAGLQLALSALGVKPGDEVILPSLTFCATANVVVHLGARPVLVEVGEDFNLEPAAVERAVTSKTRAVMPVHYGGQACDLSAVYEIAARHRLAVIEDAAHAVGSVYRGASVGSDALQEAWPGLRRATVFSFYATKNMTTGEGGMVTCADDEAAERMRLLALHGMSRDAWKRYTAAGSWYYEVGAAGFKANMTDIQAALGIHQLRRLGGFIETRQKYARRYDEAFASLPEVGVPARHTDRKHVYHLYVIRLAPERLAIDRAQFINELTRHNIGASVHFIPVHLHPFYRERFGSGPGDLPRTESLYEQIVSLPLYPLMTAGDVEYVIEVVSQIITSNRL